MSDIGESTTSPTEEELPSRTETSASVSYNPNLPKYNIDTHKFLKPERKKPGNIPFQKDTRLPDFVSKWKRKHAEKLNIYYHSSYLPNALDVLLKKGKISEFTGKQIQYMNTLKTHLHFDAVLLDEKTDGTFATHEFYSKHLKPILDGIRKKVKPSRNEEDKNESFLDIMAKVHIDDFIKELDEHMEVTQQVFIDDTKKSSVVEGVYSQLFYRFATMCHLRPRFGEAAISYWQGLMGTNVSSKPDFRLCKKGISYEEDDDPFSVVSVVEIKQEKIVKEPLKKKRKGSSLSSGDSSSTDDASTSGDSSSTDDASTSIPEIEADLDKYVLGQHAGELLLDVRKYAKGNDKMLGMIVNGTKVYITLLDITRNHMVKLYEKKKLDNDKDVATIYYAKPLDILIEEDRNVLIENFMRLNNFQFSS